MARMDSTVAAGWIGFGSALVGGGMAWLGGWLTMRSQWEKELRGRRMDRLDDAMATLQAAASPLSTAVLAGSWSERQLEPVSYACLAAVARARSVAPHLAGVLIEMADALHERAAKAQMTGIPEERRLLVGAVVGINGCTINWMENPAKFERDKLAAEHFLTKGEPESL